MAFFEYRLDTGISAGARGGPAWNTSKAMVIGGQRKVNRNWTAPLHRYDLAYGIKTAAHMETVRALFFNVFGAYDGFRYKDFADFVALQANGTLTLISGSIYQMGKSYTAGARSFVRTIYKPVSGSATIYRTRSAVSSNITGSSTINTTNGQVTVTGHVGGDTYAWAGEFDVPVAFVEDFMDQEIQGGGVSNLWVKWSSVKIEEIRVT